MNRIIVPLFIALSFPAYSQSSMRCELVGFRGATWGDISLNSQLIEGHLSLRYQLHTCDYSGRLTFSMREHEEGLVEVNLYSRCGGRNHHRETWQYTREEIQQRLRYGGLRFHAPPLRRGNFGSARVTCR